MDEPPSDPRLSDVFNKPKRELKPKPRKQENEYDILPKRPTFTPLPGVKSPMGISGDVSKVPERKPRQQLDKQLRDEREKFNRRAKRNKDKEMQRLDEKYASPRYRIASEKLDIQNRQQRMAKGGLRGAFYVASGKRRRDKRKLNSLDKQSEALEVKFDKEVNAYAHKQMLERRGLESRLKQSREKSELAIDRREKIQREFNSRSEKRKMRVNSKADRSR